MWRILCTCAVIWGTAQHLSGQTQVNGGRTILGAWDASGAASTKPAKSGTALPATCGTGEQFFKSDAAAGRNLYLCTAPNTWTAASSAAVTSVGLVMPPEFGVSGSPVTDAGTLTVSKTNQNANQVYAGPSSGGAAQPAFRALAAADLPGNNRISTFGITIDGGGNPIATGAKGYVTIPFACTITGYSVQADQSGSIAIEVDKKAGAIPAVTTDSLCASACPALASAQLNQSTTLTGWNAAVAANDVVGFNVGSASAVTRVNLTVNCTR